MVLNGYINQDTFANTLMTQLIIMYIFLLGNDSVGRVVIWNMQAILSKEEDASVPKLLCQLDHHNG